MPTVINVADIVEKNGKTIRQNNLELKHNIPIGTLVEVKRDEWFGNGACEKSILRLFVISHDRDCDGTPLYSLCKNRTLEFNGAKILVPDEGKQYVFNEQITSSIMNDIKTGYLEESLKPIKLTEKVIQGENSLRWKRR